MTAPTASEAQELAERVWSDGPVESLTDAVDLALRAYRQAAMESPYRTRWTATGREKAA